MDEELNKLPQEPAEASPEEKREERPGHTVFEWLQMAMGCILIAVICFNCVARLSRVDGHSMDPTLQHGELMVVRSLGYHPKQGDVVVLNKTVAEFLGGPGGEAIVKRVIALGGQTVDIDYEANQVSVDGVPLEEPYILEEMWWPGDPYMQGTHFVVPEGEIFVMGDNRNGSTDSRHEWLGTVNEDYLLGKAQLAIFPPECFGPIR